MDKQRVTEAGGFPADVRAAAVPEGAPLPRRGERRGEEPMSENIRNQLRTIRAMDPEMEDVNAILRSEAGGKFQEYVRKGLDFVDAYTLAARDRLGALRDRKTEAAVRSSAGSKDHLAATSSRGEGSLNVPSGELAMIRELNPDASEAEIRAYYNMDKKRVRR